MDFGTAVGIAVVAAFAILTIGRVIWEKRTKQPEYKDAEAVGGWVGSVPKD